MLTQTVICPLLKQSSNEGLPFCQVVVAVGKSAITRASDGRLRFSQGVINIDFWEITNAVKRVSVITEQGS